MKDSGTPVAHGQMEGRRTKEALQSLHDALATEVAAGAIRRELARMVLAWYRDGRIVAPNARAAALVHEVFDEAGIDVPVEVAHGSEPRGETRPERPIARQRRKRPGAARTPRPSNKPQKAPPVRDDRRSAWARANEDAVADIIRVNAASLTELAGQPVATLQEADDLGLLPKIVERYGANLREHPILPGAAAGSPTARVREERLPALQRKVGAIQSAFPFVPDEPEYVLPVFIRGVAGLDDGGNGPVPLAWRLWYEALLSAPQAAFGSTVTLPVTLADLVTFAGWTRWRPERHLMPLAEALLALDGMRIPYRGSAWRPVAVTNVPASFGFDPETRILFNVSLPADSRYGPQIDREALRSLAPRSFPRYRALLGLSAYWDKYGTGKGGVDAVRTNPNAQRWPVLTRESLRLLMFPGREHREYRARAVRHAKTLQAAGLIEMVEDGGGWRIYRPPRPDTDDT